MIDESVTHRSPILPNYFQILRIELCACLELATPIQWKKYDDQIESKGEIKEVLQELH